VRIDGAICLVTGASSGIGRATAAALAEAGGRVLALGRDANALQAVVEMTHGRAIVADLARGDDVERAAREAIAVHGGVDVLVNNAGAGAPGPLVHLKPDAVDRIVAVNLLAPIRLTRAVLPGMLERRRGHVVNVGSIAGHVGVAKEAVYAATKGGLITFSHSLQFEVAGSGVGVTVVTPGAVDTAFFERQGRPYDRRVPRLVAPDRVARRIIEAVRRGRFQVYEPRWMAFPAWLRGTAPPLYRALARRMG
jgi:short-subunit dehydrogenase